MRYGTACPTNTPVRTEFLEDCIVRWTRWGGGDPMHCASMLCQSAFVANTTMRLTALLFLSVWLVVIDASSDASTAFLEANKAKPGVVTLPSGLQYKVLTSGDGTDHPTVRSPCICHYKGTLIDGTQFDSSYDRGRPATFAPNQVIKGWTEAMQMMVEGDKWELYIPSDLAYGKHGRPPKIPGGAALVFTMEIVKINGPRVPKKERTEDL